MSDASTKHMIDSYTEESEAPMFLSGFFQSPPRNFHTSEKVEIDVIRDDEDVAIVIQDLSAGARHNESTKYVNKGFTPPIYDEQGAIHSYDMIKRSAGEDPFQDPNYGANAVREAFRIFRKLEAKIRRAVELMASQVLQTGVLTLTDKDGNQLYKLDFQPKSTHIATVGTAWATDGSTGNPLADIANLATVVRRDGKKQPTQLIFGTSALQRFLANANVQKALDKTVLNIGQLAPTTRGQGATFYGWVWVGYYRLEIWTYDGFYRDPASGDHVPYVGANNMIMLSDGGRLDLTFGAIPMLVKPDSRVMPFLPPRISSPDRGLDLTTNAWVTADGKHVFVSAGTRPLTVPTAIDTYACLTVQP